MGFVHGMRTLRALAAGTLTGAQLQAKLANGTERASWQELLTSRSAVRFLQDSPTALAAVGASPLAVADIVRSAVASPQVCSDRFALNVLQAAPAGGGILGGERDTGLALESLLRYATAGTPSAYSADLLPLKTLSALRSSASGIAAMMLSDKTINLIASSEAYQSIILGARSQSEASEFQKFAKGPGNNLGIVKMVAAIAGQIPADVKALSELISNAKIKAAWMGRRDLYMAVADIAAATAAVSATTSIGAALNAGRVLDGLSSNADLAAATSWAAIAGDMNLVRAVAASSAATAFLCNAQAGMAAMLGSAAGRTVLYVERSFWDAALGTSVGRLAIGGNALALEALGGGAANAALIAVGIRTGSFYWNQYQYPLSTNIPQISPSGGIVTRYALNQSPDGSGYVKLRYHSVDNSEINIYPAGATWTSKIFGCTMSSASAASGGVATNSGWTGLSLEFIPYRIA